MPLGRNIAGALSSLFFLLMVSGALAGPVGQYDVVGTNPGNERHYKGSVSVEKTGDTYRVVWVIGETRYIGTGIGNDDFLAVSYRTGDQTGLARYVPSDDGWKGIWTYASGTTIGTERWVER